MKAVKWIEAGFEAGRRNSDVSGLSGRRRRDRGIYWRITVSSSAGLSIWPMALGRQSCLYFLGPGGLFDKCLFGPDRFDPRLVYIGDLAVEIRRMAEPPVAWAIEVNIADFPESSRPIDFSMLASLKDEIEGGANRGNRIINAAGWPIYQRAGAGFRP